MPPEHTLIIEGNISSSIAHTTRQRIDRHLKHRGRDRKTSRNRRPLIREPPVPRQPD